MLRDALFLARMDARYLLTRRETILWTFVMPIIFFYFIGTITGGNRGPADSRDPIAVSVPADAGFLADQVVARLQAAGYRIVRPPTQQEFEQYPRRLEIPAAFTASALAGKPVNVKFSRTGEDMNADYDRVRMARAVYTVLADLIAIASAPGASSPDRVAPPANSTGAVTAEQFAELARVPRTLTLEVKPAGKRVEPPSGFEQSVPGTMVMFTLLVLFTSGAVSLTIERNTGILKRLASSPMSRGAVVLGKWGARMAVGVVQIAFAMVTGSVLFHVRWGANLPAVALVLVTYGALASTLGMLLGNLGRTEGQVIGFGVIASNVLAALGGCWWPIEVTPLWAQKLALFLPTGLAMDALHKLVNFGDSAAAALPHVCVLALAALAAGWFLARSFKFQ
jgi:ABC-2 type transport system permease protein